MSDDQNPPFSSSIWGKALAAACAASSVTVSVVELNAADYLLAPGPSGTEILVSKPLLRACMAARRFAADALVAACSEARVQLAGASRSRVCGTSRVWTAADELTGGSALGHLAVAADVLRSDASFETAIHGWTAVPPHWLASFENGYVYGFHHADVIRAYSRMYPPDVSAVRRDDPFLRAGLLIGWEWARLTEPGCCEDCRSFWSELAVDDQVARDLAWIRLFDRLHRDLPRAVMRTRRARTTVH